MIKNRISFEIRFFYFMSTNELLLLIGNTYLGRGVGGNGSPFTQVTSFTFVPLSECCP